MAPPPSDGSRSRGGRSRRSSSSGSVPRDGSGRGSSRGNGRGRGRGRGGGRGRGPRTRRASHVLSSLEALPPALFRHVVGFCEDLHSPDVAAELDEWAFVSKAVSAHMREVTGQQMRTTMRVHIQTGSRQEILALRRRVLHRRAHLREMRVEVRSWVDVKTEDAECLLEQVVLQIAEMVSHAPQLELLDLGDCQGDVVPIVNAAATSCRRLHSLLLPRYLPARSSDHQTLLHALYAGFQQWHRSGSGLRRLWLPTGLAIYNALVPSVDFLLRVYTYCPNIEALEGAYSPGSLSSGRFFVDRTVWERFCETCTRLRSIDWLGLPWTTDFFEIFAKYRKPQLAELTLRTSMEWDWKAYFEQVGRSETAAAKASGYGATANRVHLVLRACHGLKSLTVVLNSRITDETLPFKRENAVSIGLVSDKFCQALARSCPLLETFSVKESSPELAIEQQVFNVIRRFQDPALQALARLQHLNEVNLPAVNVTGDGIFALVNAKATEACGTRCYTLTIGDYTGSGKKDVRFYTAVLQFLKRLRHHKGELSLVKKRVFVCIKNGHDDDMDEGWSEGYLRQLKGAIRALRRAHPTLTFRVDVDGLKSRTFDTIYAVGVYSAGAELPDDSRWVDLPEDALVEDVFVQEEVMEDYYDDYDEYLDAYGNLEEDEHYEEDEDYEEDDDYDSAGDDGYYGDYQGERGFYGIGGYDFFNGLQLPDSGPMRGGRHVDDDNGHDFYDHAGWDY